MYSSRIWAYPVVCISLCIYKHTNVAITCLSAARLRSQQLLPRWSASSSHPVWPSRSAHSERYCYLSLDPASYPCLYPVLYHNVVNMPIVYFTNVFSIVFDHARLTALNLLDFLHDGFESELKNLQVFVRGFELYL